MTRTASTQVHRETDAPELTQFEVGGTILDTLDHSVLGARIPKSLATYEPVFAHDRCL